MRHLARVTKGKAAGGGGGGVCNRGCVECVVRDRGMVVVFGRTGEERIEDGSKDVK